MDIGIVLFYLLPVLESFSAKEYNDTYWTTYNYTSSAPYFDKSFSKNVTLLQGKTACLKCRTLNAENRTISWIRHRDLHLLTIGLQSYTNDQRFQAVHVPQLNLWKLQIKYAQIKDSGAYMCQVSTTPPTTQFLHLLVVQSSIQILGGPEIYIIEKGLLNLTCIVENISGLPFYIKWSHNNQEVNYELSRGGGVSLMTEKIEDVIKSYLLIQNTMPSDSGIYTCSVTDLISHQIMVHVLKDYTSVAIRNKGQQIFNAFLLRCLAVISIMFPLKLFPSLFFITTE